MRVNKKNAKQLTCLAFFMCKAALGAIIKVNGLLPQP